MFVNRGAVVQVAAINWREKALLLWLLLVPFLMLAIFYAQSFQQQVKTVHCQQSFLSACYVLANAEEAPLKELVSAADAIIHYNDMNNLRRETKSYQTAFDGYAMGYKFAVGAGLLDSTQTYNLLAEHEAHLRDAARSLLNIVGTQEV